MAFGKEIPGLGDVQFGVAVNFVYSEQKTFFSLFSTIKTIRQSEIFFLIKSVIEILDKIHHDGVFLRIRYLTVILHIFFALINVYDTLYTGSP